MSQAGVREDRVIAALERMVTSRVLLLAVGLACAGLGALAIWLPLSLFGALVWLVGALLLGTGVIKLLQLWPGRRSRAARRQTWALILSQARAGHRHGIAAREQSPDLAAIGGAGAGAALPGRGGRPNSGWARRRPAPAAG
jgi:hypothetical protein